jgi:hypothetical protein
MQTAREAAHAQQGAGVGPMVQAFRPFPRRLGPAHFTPARITEIISFARA